jgi:hypothetical protein
MFTAKHEEREGSPSFILLRGAGRKEAGANFVSSW